ncbi:MAG: methionine biosynthesis protein MetW [Proteobacteria bacterium]|nr:methionine biosynthesis protein MetW [Pseudomonadota bacterium]
MDAASPPADPSLPADAHRPLRIRVDLQAIADMVTPGSRVLDVGCGEGTLLDYLVHFKQVDGRGIELSQAAVTEAVGHGLSVIQGDAEADLKIYPDDAFDFVILSQTLQATRDSRATLRQLLRIGRRVIVSFTNYGHWRLRCFLLWRGRVPVTNGAAHRWYDTPNIHVCTIHDFIDLCRELGVRIERRLLVNPAGRVRRFRSVAFANLCGEQGVFLLSRP